MRGSPLFIALALFLSAPSLAFADARGSARERGATEAETPSGYDETVQRALDEFELANYAEARSLLLQAHELYPNARTSRALGMVEFELKNYVSCVDYLEQALDSQTKPLTAEQRREAEQLLGRANGFVGRYTIALRPSAAALLIDGQPVRPDARGVLRLPVGDHQLEATAEGHRPLRRTLSVAGGRSEQLDVVLLPAAADDPVSAHEAPSAAPTPVYKKWWLWTTLGVVVAAGAVTGIVLATREPKPKEPNGGSINQTFHLLSWR